MTNNIERDKLKEVILAVLTIYRDQTTEDEMNDWRLLRLMYLVDKTHLEHGGRIVSTDIYDADILNGAIPRHTKEMVIASTNTEKFGFEYTNSRFALSRPPDYDQLSESDIDAIRLVIKYYGNLPQWHLRQLCKDEGWKKVIETKDDLHWTGRKILVEAEDMAACFDNGDLLIEYLHI